MPATRPRWTQLEDEQLRKLYREGLDDFEIGKRIGRSEKSISSRRQIVGLRSEVRMRPVSGPAGPDRTGEIFAALDANYRRYAGQP